MFKKIEINLKNQDHQNISHLPLWASVDVALILACWLLESVLYFLFSFFFKREEKYIHCIYLLRYNTERSPRE